MINIKNFRFVKCLLIEIAIVFMLFFISATINAQDIPLVYDVENTGANFAKPVLPSIGQLPKIEPLPDPFEWSDGSGRSTEFKDWSKRRNEIKAELEHYEIGIKPDRPEDITASFNGSVLTVNVTVNGNTLKLTSNIQLPSGEGPFPAIIGIGFGTGSLPSNIFSDRNIAQITFNYDQVMAHTQKRGSEPINKLYPELTYIGAYSAWSWGVSRIIDGLELVADDLPIDLKHLAISGCSFAGKMALWAGAFDERIALTIAQEPGGGGAAAWRVSQTLGDVENLGATSRAWFIEDMFKFSGNNVSKLPHDHHELIAMVAPRALLVLGNPDYKWLAEESGYVSCRAAHQVWEAFGIPERFGYSFVDGHTHCALPPSQVPEVEAFVDAFLLGDESANTNITTNSYDDVDYTYWTEWWGTGNPDFPPRPQDAKLRTYLEAECGIVGENWDIIDNARVSGKKYVTASENMASIDTAPINSSDHINIVFDSLIDTTVYVYGRVNCASTESNSFWIGMDKDKLTIIDGLGTSGWEWKKLGEFDLTEGEHNLIIAYRENGAKLDKLFITDFPAAPTGLGEGADNLCITNVEEVGSNNNYYLKQNFPNPFNPVTEIAYEIPTDAMSRVGVRKVNLIVHNILGQKVATLVNEIKPPGNYKVRFDGNGLPSGTYFYTLYTGDFVSTKKMTLLK